MTWRFVNTGFHSGMFNMEFDKDLAAQFSDHSSGESVLRLYGWKPHAVSIGYHQEFEDFDLDALRESGIDIVRRPTGGKAILHAHELTYSVVYPLAGTSPKKVYRFIHEGLLVGLQHMGIHAELSEGDPLYREQFRDPASVPCFSSSAKSEIQFHSRKLVGSAQRRFGTVVLQHGSFLLGPHHQRLTHYLAPHLRGSQSILEQHLERHTIDAESILCRSVSFEEASSAIRTGFEEFLGYEFEELSVESSSLLFTHLSEAEGI